jgi:hypothetical protein
MGYSKTATIIVKNDGEVPLNFVAGSPIEIAGTSVFSIQSTTCGGILSVGGSCDATVQFSPLASETYAGKISFSFVENFR